MIYLSMSYKGTPMSAYNYYDDNGYTIPLINYPVTVLTYAKTNFGSELINSDLQRYTTSNGQGAYTTFTPVYRPTVWDLFFQLAYAPMTNIQLEQYNVDMSAKGLEVYTDEFFDGTNISEAYGGYTESFADYLDGANFQLSNNIDWRLTGSATSSYNEKYLGRDQNFIYSRNFRYPMMSPGWGASDDYILLNDGNVINIAFFDDWNFYKYPGAGFYIPPFAVEQATKNDVFYMEFGLQTIMNDAVQLVDIIDLTSNTIYICSVFNLTDNINTDYYPTVIDNKLVVDFSDSNFVVGKDYAIIVSSSQQGSDDCFTAPAMCRVQVR